MEQETVGSYHRKNTPPRNLKWLGTRNSAHKLFVIHPYLWTKEATREQKRQRKFTIYNDDGSISLYQEVININYSPKSSTMDICYVTQQEKYRTHQDLCIINKIDLTTLIGLN